MSTDTADTASRPSGALRPGPHPFRTLLMAAVLGPALLFAAMSWWSWERLSSETQAAIKRNVDILHAHAEGLFQTDAQLLARIDDRVAGMDWSAIAANEAALHDFLVNVASEGNGVDGAFIADPNGEPWVLSNRFPVPAGLDPAPTPANVADRAYFPAARKTSRIIVDGPNRSRLAGQLVLDVVRRLSSPDGSFRGIVTLLVSPSRFSNFWETVIAPGDTATLVKDDGTILARYPALPMEPGAPMPRLTAAAVARLHQAPSGQFDAPASMLDGVARRIGFRKLDKFPIYVVYARDRGNVLREWYPIAAAFAGLAGAAAIGLTFAAKAVIRRARGEAEALALVEGTSAALRLSEENLRALFRNAPAAMHALDVDARITDVNERWLELFGYSRDEVIGKRISDFHDPAMPPAHISLWHQILESGKLRELERRFAKKSGEVFDALISATIERDSQGFRRAISVVTDVTARRQAEAAARKERRFSELLIESTAEGIIGKDNQLRFTLWNRGMEAMTGLPRETVLGRTAEAISSSAPDSSTAKAWLAALEGTRTTLHDRPYGITETGRSGFYDQNLAPLRDGAGVVIGAIAFVQEASDRHHMEEVLRQAQKMEAVGQLTGGIAHDFNNLLTVIIGNLEALRRRGREAELQGSPNELVRLTDAAMRGAQRAATLTQRLLAFSRRQPLDPKSVDANLLVSGMSDLLRRTLGESIAIEAVLPSGIWRILADANQLESAILNLAVNARDAMADGGTLTLETANAEFGEAYAGTEADLAPGQYVMIAVTDTGTGMSPEVTARAFEPFYTTKDIGKGSGLGLSQVYGFVKQSGGHVKINSEEGHGTTIKLYLPRWIAEEAQDEDSTRNLPRPATAAGETILAVEDDEDVRAYTTELLRELGYRVVTAADAVDGLRELEANPEVSLLFTDVGLPGGFDGRKLAEEARRRRPGLKVLFTTGYAKDAISPEGRLEAAVDLVVKPFSYDDLAEKLRQILDGRDPASRDRRSDS